MENEFDNEAKQEFAQAWAEDPSNPFRAALKVFDCDTGEALRIQRILSADPLVIKIKNEIENEVILPTKNQLALKALLAADEKSQDGARFVHDGKTRVMFMRLAAEIMGAVGKNDDEAVIKSPKKIPTDTPRDQLEATYQRLLK